MRIAILVRVAILISAVLLASESAFAQQPQNMSDAQLLAWGAPIRQRLEAVMNEYEAAVQTYSSTSPRDPNRETKNAALATQEAATNVKLNSLVKSDVQNWALYLAELARRLGMEQRGAAYFGLFEIQAAAAKPSGLANDVALEGQAREVLHEINDLTTRLEDNVAAQLSKK